MSKHILKMQARAVAAVQATNAASVSVLHALACHVADVHARATRAVKLNEKRLNDAAEEADINAKQLIALTALLKYYAYDAFDALVFNFKNPSYCWLALLVANFDDVDLSLLHRVFSAGIDAARTSVHGQGLTAFDPSDGPEARQQNVICILPRDADGNLAEWVTATDIRLELVSPGEETTLSFDITGDQDGWRVVYIIAGRPDNICINLYICKALVCKGLVRAETPASAAERAKAIGAKKAAATQADCHDLVGIATAFPTDADVQEKVCDAMRVLAAFGYAGGARKLIAAGGHRVAIAALGVFSTNARASQVACRALHYIACHGGADAIAAMCAVDGVMDKLRQASDVMRAAGRIDLAAATVLAWLK